MNNTKPYSSDIIATIKHSLDNSNISYTFNENTGSFDFTLRVRARLHPLSCSITTCDNEILFYAICPLCVDDMDFVTTGRMAKYICRINCDIRNGCFEFNACTGEIRYKSYIDCEGIVPTATILKNAVNQATRMYELHAPGIIDIIGADTSDIFINPFCKIERGEK